MNIEYYVIRNDKLTLELGKSYGNVQSLDKMIAEKKCQWTEYLIRKKDN